MSNEIESASGRAAYNGTDWPEHLAPPEQYVTVYSENRGMVSVCVVPAGPQADDHTPTLSRKREHVWSEVHDAFDTATADVDARCGGDPVGSQRSLRSRSGE